MRKKAFEECIQVRCILLFCDILANVDGFKTYVIVVPFIDECV